MGRFAIKHPYAWLYCAFAALGACLYGYDGVYFTGVTAMQVFADHFGNTVDATTGLKTISASQLSLLTSMINVGELVGSLSAAPLNDYLGRKAVLLIGAITVTIGVILQLVANSGDGLIIGGRIILGFGVGNFSSTSLLYMGEIAPTEIRSPLLCSWQLVLSCSQIIAAGISRGTETMSTTAAYRIPIGLQLLFPFIVIVFIYWVPESPRWLVRKGRSEKASQSLRAVHQDDKSYDPSEDMAMLQADLDREMAAAVESSWLDLVRDPVERRKVIFSAGALIAQQVNGIQWFYYFGTVFSKSIGLEDPFLMTLIVFIIQVFVVFLAVLFSNKIPRRPLLLTTTGMMMVSIFIVGCLGIPSADNISPAIGKVIISFVIIEIVAFNFAWGPLGWTIASEMAVGRNRSKIYAIAVACFWITVWVIVFTLPYIYYTGNLGPKTGFVYTGLCCISMAYVWFCVGETKGRTMEEINGFFLHNIPARRWKDQPRFDSLPGGDEYMHGIGEKKAQMEVDETESR